MEKKLIYIIIVCFMTFGLHAQNGQDQNRQLAEQFFQNGEFEKAVPLYQKVLKQDKSDSYIYNALIKSLIELENLNGAVKEIKKQIKSFPGQLQYNIDLGHIYGLQEQKKKSIEQYDFVLENISPDERIIHQIAQQFKKVKQFNYAVNTYLIGQKKLRQTQVFNAELSSLYLLLDKIPEYIDIKVQTINLQPNQLDNIIGDLNNDLTKKEHYTLLKSTLYKNVQKRNNNIELNQLLIWTLQQLKEYSAALTQAKALDKRLDNGGKFTYELAEHVFQKKDYNQAIKIYSYLLENGINYYKIPSKSAILSCKKEILATSDTISEMLVLDLINDYKSFLTSGKQHQKAIQSQLELADLYSIYLNDHEQAIHLLRKALDELRLSQIQKAKFKLKLGDIQTYSGDVWEAMLTYGQVDKDFKDSPIGDQAKFKVAMISYYTGEFDWAQNQLDVLKASTSKVIANDALSISTFITDNYGLDSSHAPMLLYAQAELLLLQQNREASFNKLDSIIMRFPGHTLTDDVLFKKASTFIKSREEDKAIPLLNKIIEFYSEDLLIDNAIFSLAEIYLNQGEKEKAKNLYESIILKHSDSIFVIESRKKYRKLRGDSLN